MEYIDKQIIQELIISDENEYETLLIKQTWSYHLLALVLNQERCHIPRLGGFSEDIVPQLNNKQFLRHFRVSPEIFIIVLNSIIHSLDDNPWPGGSEPILPEKQLLIFLWYILSKPGILARGGEYVCGWCYNRARGSCQSFNGCQ